MTAFLKTDDELITRDEIVERIRSIEKQRETLSLSPKRTEDTNKFQKKAEQNCKVGSQGGRVANSSQRDLKERCKRKS